MRPEPALGTLIKTTCAWEWGFVSVSPIRPCLSRWYPRLISREGLLARIAPRGPVPLLNPAYPQEHTFPVGGRIFR